MRQEHEACDVTIVTPEQFPFLDMRYTHPIRFRGRVFPSAENAFQSARFSDPTTISKFQYIPPDRAAYLGAAWRTTADNWDDRRTDILEDVLYMKFSDRPMREQLSSLPKNARVRMLNHRHENDLGSCQCRACRDRGADIAGTVLSGILAKLR